MTAQLWTPAHWQVVGLLAVGYVACDVAAMAWAKLRKRGKR